MNYKLNQQKTEKVSAFAALVKLWPLVRNEKQKLFVAFFAILVNASANLVAPIIVGRAVDTFIRTKSYHGILISSIWLFGVYVLALVSSYLQTKWMGGVGQRVLFNLRNAVFAKLQELPIAFFNQNKAGDLISRINNDTDKLNQFFSQSLMQFIGNIFIMIGAGIFLLSISFRLGLTTIAPALVLLVLTRILSPWVKRQNAKSSASVGNMSAEIQESLNNFKVVVAFNRRDYFRKRFDSANNENYKTAIGAGLANNVFTPLYGISSNLAQLIVLSFGIYLIAQGRFSIGLLVSFLSYANNFYTPLRQLAALWANFQVAMAGWDRISVILALESDLQKVTASDIEKTTAVLEFKHVSFKYFDSGDILHDISMTLERGKTYALVGPTGGGKTTTASLMARLFDPTEGVVLLDGKDLRSYSTKDRTKKIGFILQEPFIFSGTLRENIFYGDERYQTYTHAELDVLVERAHIGHLLSHFEKGLDTKILNSGDAISLGQKQIIAFIRAVLREPEILIQ